jgi:hypothetical protein
MKNYTASGTIQKRIEELNKKLEERESATKERGGLPFWRGKKIISVKQWQSIASKRGGYEEVIKYIPNGFIDHPLSGLAAENGTSHRYKDEQYNKWMDDYYDYLYHSKNPQLGEKYCEKCLLEDDKDQEIHSGLGLRKRLRELLQEVLPSKDKETTATTSSSLSSSSNNSSSNATSSSHNCVQKGRQRTQAVSAANKQKKKSNAKVIRKQQLPLITIDYPCPVHNRFKCPYHESSEANDNALVGIGGYLEVIYDALSFAHMLTYQIRDYTYKVDFEKDKKLETISKYGFDFARDSSKRLGVELGSLNQPKVPIESIHDIYKALTDRENLDIILEQYLEHRVRNPQDYGDNPNFDYAKRKEMGDTLRRSIVDWFMQMKDDIRMEDLTNFNGITLQEEEEENIKRRSLDQSAAITVDHSNDICYVCNKRGACILCVNCDKWICADHWFNHKGVHRHL